MNIERRTFLKWTAAMVGATLLPVGLIREIYAGYESKDHIPSGFFTGLSSNPADAYIHVLKTITPPVPDSRIDLISIKNWHDYCEINNLKFNKAIEPYSTTAWIVISDICIAGKATVLMSEGKWTVTFDFPNKPVMQEFTSHNNEYVDMPMWDICVRLGDKIKVTVRNKTFEAKVIGMYPISAEITRLQFKEVSA